MRIYAFISNTRVTLSDGRTASDPTWSTIDAVVWAVNAGAVDIEIHGGKL